MNDSMEINECLETMAAVFLWCFILNFLVLMLWFLILVFGGSLAHSIHSSFYDITRQQFDLLWYGGMGLFKIAIFLFYLCPYLAIKIVLAKRYN